MKSCDPAVDQYIGNWVGNEKHGDGMLILGNKSIEGSWKFDKLQVDK